MLIWDIRYKQLTITLLVRRGPATASPWYICVALMTLALELVLHQHTGGVVPAVPLAVVGLCAVVGGRVGGIAW